ncbi:iron ABC transporter permease [Cellulomonas sp. IC4_254]|uniref:general stress protein n=1 Tax=Cellulomonas sp. IC4_254 TaxID=2714040 RepID=UPI0014202D46|nr:iron ABC transporter permease [Cellulomonas sp. IC4_254]NHT18531.1 iron ABC transporter permease [Cellulomonas sp. IC4_254]
MSFTGGARIPQTPTLPQGETVASYGTYLEAQKAVDHLSDHQFPVQMVTIVGTDLRMVERVTGRLTYARVAMGGFGSGAWFGVFIGLLFLLSGGSSGILFAAVLFGGAAGLLLAVLVYATSRGRRDFTSQSQIVAAQYAVLCRAERAHEARQMLREVGGVRVGAATPVPPAAPMGARPSDPTGAYGQPAAPGRPGQPPAGPGQPPAQPRYGQLAPQPPAEPRYGQLAPQPPAAPPAGPETPGAEKQD